MWPTATSFRSYNKPTAPYTGKKIPKPARWRSTPGPEGDFQPARNEARAPRAAVQALADADIVVLGPGSLFTSVITNLLVPDITRALSARRHGKVLYVCNIVTQPGQTDGFGASDHLRAILRHFPEKHTGILDHMLVQDPDAFHRPGGRKWQPVLNAYLRDGKEPVRCDPDEIRRPGNLYGNRSTGGLHVRGKEPQRGRLYQPQSGQGGRRGLPGILRAGSAGLRGAGQWPGAGLMPSSSTWTTPCSTAQGS